MMPEVGNEAPDFTALDEQGNTVRLHDLRDKKVILYFYPKDNTPGCTSQACNLRDNYPLLESRNYVILGVSSDGESSHQKFIQTHELPFRLLVDSDQSVHEKYGTWVTKMMYGRKYMGTERVTFVINEKGFIDKIISKVDTRNHTQQILDA